MSFSYNGVCFRRFIFYCRLDQYQGVHCQFHTSAVIPSWSSSSMLHQSCVMEYINNTTVHSRLNGQRYKPVNEDGSATHWEATSKGSKRRRSTKKVITNEIDSGTWLNLSRRCGNPCQTSSSVWSAIINKQTKQTNTKIDNYIESFL